MQADIQAAISVDGFIATPDGDSDWVQDSELFEQTVREYGCICLGHRTFLQYEKELFPIEGVEHIVLSHKLQSYQQASVYSVQSVARALAKAKELGFDRVLVIGGGQTNGSFLAAGAVDKLLLDIHPLLLGEGIKLFGDFDQHVQLHLQSIKEEPRFLTVTYRIEQ